ncbi:MAG: hypothetical protein BWY35_02406 [Firmicutes bacterium ADurb.Bin248]|nr:MAG: hypothetical protein BWY35_02406 [Firmicutes bacterium ADurb.Bin248]
MGQRFRHCGVDRARDGAYEDAGNEADQYAAEIALKLARGVEGRKDESDRRGQRGRHERPHEEAEQPGERAHHGARFRAQQQRGDDDGYHGERRHDRADRGQRAKRRKAEQRFYGKQYGELRHAEDFSSIVSFGHARISPLHYKYDCSNIIPVPGFVYNAFGRNIARSLIFSEPCRTVVYTRPGRRYNEKTVRAVYSGKECVSWIILRVRLWTRPGKPNRKLSSSS